MHTTLIFVLYDGITNSIFDGQIAKPLLDQKKNNPELQIILISFEKDITQDNLKKSTSQYPEIRFILLKKYIFIHRLLLFPLVKQLHTLLRQFSAYHLIARGPLAAYLCHKAVPATQCTNLTIQARGLLAEEYRYTHQKNNNFFSKIVHKIRAHLFETLEKISYSQKNTYFFPITIEVVSPALKEYLTHNFNADKNSVFIARHDIPASFAQDLCMKWRNEIRTQLHLTQRYVYCYNGSLKPWQCPYETISFFKNKLKENPKAFLLILSQDAKEFEQALQQSGLKKKYYKVLTVAHHEIYRYLAACDAGLLFRDKNILNWVSRPTKALEYQAVGLPIVHNNTIAFLQE